MGLPPGNSKFSNDAAPVTTFFWQFPNMTATHVGVTAIAGTLSVAGGGTGDTSFTAYSVITGGTTSTGALQSVSGVGTSGQVLTSNGPAALPTWQAASSGGGSA